MSFIHEIKFDPSYIEIGSVTKHIHALTDILMTPARYLFNGKTVTLYDVKYTIPGSGSRMSYLRAADVSIIYPKEKCNLLKTMIAIILLIPGTIYCIKI